MYYLEIILIVCEHGPVTDLQPAASAIVVRLPWDSWRGLLSRSAFPDKHINLWSLKGNSWMICVSVH